jgi:hypothetical protein
MMTSWVLLLAAKLSNAADTKYGNTEGEITRLADTHAVTRSHVHELQAELQELATQVTQENRLTKAIAVLHSEGIPEEVHAVVEQLEPQQKATSESKPGTRSEMAWSELAATTLKTAWQISPGGSRSDYAEDPRHCLRNQRIVMVGDSLMRYQYMSLVYWVEHGKPPPDGVGGGTKDNQEKHSVCNEWSWPGVGMDGDGDWNTFFRGTTKKLNDHCDCWHSQPISRVENRYYHSEEFNISLTYLWWYGLDASFRGHWKDGRMDTCEPGDCKDSLPFKWEYHPPEIPFTFEQILVNTVKPLKPTALMINCGMWHEYCPIGFKEKVCPVGQYCPNKFDAAFAKKVAEAGREIVAPQNGIAIWKTTTSTLPGQKHKPLQILPEQRKTFEEAGWKIWDVGEFTRSYTHNKTLFRITKDGRQDHAHFHCIVHTAVNINLIEETLGCS